MTAEVPLNKTIKKNSFLIPGKFEDQETQSKKKLVYSNEIMNKLGSAVKVRKQGTLHFFETKLFGITQSIAEISTSLYHWNKSIVTHTIVTHQLQ